MTTKASSERPRTPLYKLLRVLTLGCCLAASALVGLAAVLIYVQGEQWWPTSLVLFGPTWLLHLVLAASGVAWSMFHRGIGLAVLLALSELVLLMPVLGYQPPWPNSASPPSGAPVRLVTWNIGGRLDYTEVKRLFGEHRADIVVFQECGGLTKDSMPPELATLSAHECSGMCMLSRFPVTKVEDRDRKDVWDVGGSGAIVRYTFAGPDGPFTLTNVHLETPREGFEDFIHHGLGPGIATLSAKNAQRYTEARLAHEWTEREPLLPRLVAGDFNTPPQSDLLRDNWLGFSNCFSVTEHGFGHTKETRWLGVRIDHVLASTQWSCVNTEMLSGFSSDHHPVLATVTLTQR
jgi:vancomycin resistance protein VanJ